MGLPRPGNGRYFIICHTIGSSVLRPTKTMHISTSLKICDFYLTSLAESSIETTTKTSPLILHSVKRPTEGDLPKHVDCHHGPPHCQVCLAICCVPFDLCDRLCYDPDDQWFPFANCGSIASLLEQLSTFDSLFPSANTEQTRCGVGGLEWILLLVPW